MVHQHFMLVPVFTVAENVTLGIEQACPAGLLDRRKTRAEVAELSHRYGLDVDPDALSRTSRSASSSGSRSSRRSSGRPTC